MSRSSVLFLAFLLLPLCVVSVVAHRLISSEVARGRCLGRAYLQARAEMLAARLQTCSVPTLPTDVSELPVLAAVVDGEGRLSSGVFPDDGRCFGLASLEPRFPGLSVKTSWPGKANPGRRRAQRLHAVETAVFAGSLALFLLAVAFFLRRHWLVRRELAEQRACVRDFSHRLKTPITSISLCAELAREGRVDEARKRECAETVFVEAAKLDRIVSEVLQHIEGRRHG